MFSYKKLFLLLLWLAPSSLAIFSFLFVYFSFLFLFWFSFDFLFSTKIYIKLSYYQVYTKKEKITPRIFLVKSRKILLYFAFLSTCYSFLCFCFLLKFQEKTICFASYINFCLLVSWWLLSISLKVCIISIIC